MTSSTTEGANTGGQSRLDWADVAKGASIVLVVLWHVTTKHYQQVTWETSLPIVGAWGALGEFFLPLRMPLFFTISGMLAVGALTSINRTKSVSKIRLFFYLYVLWLIIHTAAMVWNSDFDTAIARTPGQFFAQLFISPTNLWYLYALGLYFALALVTKRVPMVPLLIIAILVSALASIGIIPNENNRIQVIENLVFFLAGYRLRPLIESFARSISWKRLALIFGGYIAAYGAVMLTDSHTVFGVRPVLAIIATACGIGLATMISRSWAPVSRVLARCGRSTLPIYVMHLPLLALFDLLMRPVMQSLEGSSSEVVAVVEPIVLTVVLVAVCLLLHRLLLKIGARWLFDVPRRQSADSDRRWSIAKRAQ